MKRPRTPVRLVGRPILAAADFQVGCRLIARPTTAAVEFENRSVDWFLDFCRTTVGPTIFEAADLSRRPWLRGDQRRLKIQLAAKIGGPTRTTRSGKLF